MKSLELKAWAEQCGLVEAGDQVGLQSVYWDAFAGRLPVVWRRKGSGEIVIEGDVGEDGQWRPKMVVGVGESVDELGEGDEEEGISIELEESRGLWMK